MGNKKSPMIKHRCNEWAGEKKIHPDCYWLWGTHLEYVDREIKDGKTGEITKNFWILMDDYSGTYSIWNNKYCPFCKVQLETFEEALNT